MLLELTMNMIMMFDAFLCTWSYIPYTYKFSRYVNFADATNSVFSRFYFRGWPANQILQISHIFNWFTTWLQPAAWLRISLRILLWFAPTRRQIPPRLPLLDYSRITCILAALWLTHTKFSKEISRMKFLWMISWPRKQWKLRPSKICTYTVLLVLKH